MLYRGNPTDIPYIEAEAAFASGPHAPVTMLSLNSRGPIKEWYCPECAAAGTPNIVRTLTTTAPRCCGGMEYF